MASPAQNEFSRPVSLESLGEKDKMLSIVANADERSRLAERLGLDGLEALSAEIRLTPRSGGRMVRLEGTLKALVRQICVITLEPVEDHIEGTVERLYDTNFEGLENGEAADNGRVSENEVVVSDAAEVEGGAITDAEAQPGEEPPQEEDQG